MIKIGDDTIKKVIILDENNNTNYIRLIYYEDNLRFLRQDRFDYISNGLVFHLDGINKGSNTDAWTDLVGDVVFENHGAESLYNCYRINNPSTTKRVSYLATSDTLKFSPDTHTLEIVFMPDDIRPFQLFATNYTNGLLFGHGINNNISWSHKKYNLITNVNINMTTLYSASVLRDKAILNGTTLLCNDSGSWNIYDSVSIIGGRPNDYTFNGKIYSIRIYDRILSEAEAIHNQLVDYDRFNF